VWRDGGRAVLAVCAVYSGPDAFGRVLRHVCGRGGPRVWGFTVGKPTPVSRFLLGTRTVGTDGNGHTSRTARGASATQTPRSAFLKANDSEQILRRRGSLPAKERGLSGGLSSATHCCPRIRSLSSILSENCSVLCMAPSTSAPMEPLDDLVERHP
jgi:hypothetical protein